MAETQVSSARGLHPAFLDRLIDCELRKFDRHATGRKRLLATGAAMINRRGNPQTTMHIPIFVIDRDRRPDPMRSIAGHLDRLGLEATRVSAVEARNVTDDELRTGVNWGTGYRLRALDRAGVACTLSHLHAMEMFLSTADAAFILEDDAESASGLPLFVGNVDWWPKNADLVKIETQAWKRYRMSGPECGLQFHGRQLRRILLWTPASGGYMLSRRATSVVLVSCDTIADSTHRILFDLRVLETARRLRPMQTLTRLVRRQLTEFVSDLDHVRKENPRIRGMRRFRRYLTVMPREAVLRGQRLTGYASRMPMDLADRRHAD